MIRAGALALEAIAAALIAACGPPPASAAAVGGLSGTVAQRALTINSSAFFALPGGVSCDGGQPLLLVLLIFSDESNVCDLYSSFTINAGSTVVAAGLAFVGADGATSVSVEPGPISISSAFGSAPDGGPGPAQYALASAEVTDASCNKLALGAVSGLITLTSFTAGQSGQAKGAANLTFEDGSTLSGTFDASSCDALGSVPIDTYVVQPSTQCTPSDALDANDLIINLYCL